MMPRHHKPTKALLFLLPAAAILVLFALAYALMWVIDDVRNQLPDAANDTLLSKRACPYGLASEYSNQVKIRCYDFVAKAGMRDVEGFFTLPLVVISPRDNEPSSQIMDRHPVVLIPGGPGDGQQTRTEHVSYWAERAIALGLQRDLVLFDPRGVGDSQPAWDCENYNQHAADVLALNVSFEEELTLSGDVLSACLLAMDDFYRSLSTLGLGLFSSRYQAQDVNQMMRALGYEQWHLWGISYGSRVALLASDAEEVKSVIVDSVYPPGRGASDDWAELLAQTHSLHAAHYAKLQIGGGDFSELLSSALAQLAAAPLTGNFSTWDEPSQSYTFVLSEHRLYALLFFVLYDPELLSSFYEGLIHLAKGPADTIPTSLDIVIESFLTVSMDNGFNAMAYFATECMDNPLVEREAFMQSIEDSALSERLARWLILEWQYNACSHPVFNGRAPLSAVQKLDKPLLILSGQMDPITPASYAAALYRDATHATLVSFPDKSHSLISTHDCVFGMITQFMQQRSVDQHRCENSEIKSKAPLLLQQQSELNVQQAPIKSPTTISTTEETLMSDPIWIDVRTAEEYAGGHYPGAINIPYEAIADDIAGLTTDKDATIYVYCRTGRRSGIAKDTLSQMGYSQVENKGGLDDVM